MNPEDVLQKMEDRLVAVVPGKVQSMNITEPVYALRLWYYGWSMSEDERVPSIMLPKENYRQRIIEQFADDLDYRCYYIWGADELTGENTSYMANIKDDELYDLFYTWAKNEDDEIDEEEAYLPIRGMMQRACSRLNCIDWTLYTTATSDFVVFPADGAHTLFDDFGDLRASVPPARVEWLLRRGLLVDDPSHE